MGCDIHIAIERQDAGGAWREVIWQQTPYGFPGARQPVDGIPVAPPNFQNRNYDLFAILANVRNGVGFAGIKMGEGWPSIAPDRRWPDGFREDRVAPDPQYPEDGPRYMGDHSYTWIGLDELKAFDWDGTVSWLYGVVTADEFEELSAHEEKPSSYSGAISGPGIVTYSPDTYRETKARGALAERPYVRMGWAMSAREATYDWPGKVIPWLEMLAAGRPLRLVLGFDS